MSNKLTSNTSSIQLILEAVNNLPNGADNGSTSDATAVAGEIFAGKTAYARGAKLTGTFTIEEELAAQNELLEELAAALEGKAAGSGETIKHYQLTFPDFDVDDLTLRGKFLYTGFPELQRYSFNELSGTTITVGPYVLVEDSGFLNTFTPNPSNRFVRSVPSISEYFTVSGDITFTFADNAPV